MAGLPTVQVLLDDGSGTFPFDISAYAQLVAGYTFKRGRQDELSSPTPGDFKLALDNTDGRFTIGSTILATPSPIKMDQAIRVKVTANATTVNRFTAYVQSWPTEWPDGGDLFALASISGLDGQSQAEGWKLRSVIECEILEDSPQAYYTLGEPSGATSVADSSGNQSAAFTMVGTGTAVTFGSATGPGTDGLTAAQFAGGQYMVRGPLSGLVALVECAFLTSTANQRLISMYDNSAGTFDIIQIDAGGHLTGPFSMVSSSVVTDGAEHVAGLRWTGAQVQLLLDGVVVASNVDTRAGSSAQKVYLGEPVVGGSAYSGTMAHVAFFTTDPGSARATAHATASLTGFVGESGTARITRTAGYANLPVGTLDTSLTNVAFVDITGKSAMEAIRDVADAELGLAYFDGSGTLVFHNRNRVVTKTTPDVTIDASFLDEGTRFEYDMQGVVNYFEVTAVGTGIVQVAQDVTSIVTNKHGKYDGSRSYLVQTDQEALDRANWIVATHKEPAPRVGSLVFDVLTMTAAQQAQMLAIEPDTWVRVTGLPGQTPGGTTADFIVQGIAETLNSDAWTLTLNAANKAVAAPTPWILDSATWSVLDSTTRLYV